MEAHQKRTIDDLLELIKRLETEAAESKRMINWLHKMAGLDPMFASVEHDTATVTTIKADTFYGQPFATCATTYLRMRKSMNLGPATVNEIYDALKSGGHQFEATNEDYAKRGVRHSLSKNTQTFHKVPNGAFGLMEWYPAVKKTRQAKAAAASPENETDADEDIDDFGGPNADHGDGGDDGPEDVLLVASAADEIKPPWEETRVPPPLVLGNSTKKAATPRVKPVTPPTPSK